MPPHSLGSGTISFGLVSIPVKLYTAASAGGVSFNQLHAKCGNRLRQQMFCPVDNEVVDRSQIVKGYEFAKDQYVRFTDEEIKSLEGEASKVIDIAEFVPLSTRSEEHTSELQSRGHLVCRLLLEKKKKQV